MMAKILQFDRSIEWETSLCERCCKGTPCLIDERPCLPLEMLRQLCLKSPGNQIEALRNVAECFEYPGGDSS